MVTSATRPTSSADTPVPHWIRSHWPKLVITVVIVLVIGWLIFSNLPRPVRADLGLIPRVDHFSYSRWHSEVEVASDADGRPVLTVTETAVARFPDHDQNKGIVRGIPANSYLDIDEVSVTDGQGREVPFDTEYDYDADVLYVLTGTEEYVHGEQTYVIRYRSTDGVVADYTRDVQELYWNLLPLDSTQTIDQFSASVRIAAELTGDLTGQYACYQGRYGSTDRCELEVSTVDGATVYEFSSGRRAAGDGVTIAVGFAAETFPRGVSITNAMQPTPYRWLHQMWDNGTVGVGVGGVGLLVGAVGVLLHRRFIARSLADRGVVTHPVVPQSGVPDTVPPPVAAALLRADRVARGKPPQGGSARIGTAEIVHLAVHGVIRFEDGQDSGKKAPLSFRLVDRGRARHSVDREMLAALFPNETAEGTVRELPHKDTKFAGAVQRMAGRGRRAAAAQGLLQLRDPFAAVCGVLGAALTVASLVMVIAAGAAERGIGLLLAIVALVAGLIICGHVLAPEPVLTERGRTARDQLRAVRAYLKQENRRQLADTVEPGVERVRDGDTDILVVYERLLPYAMLFGMATQWRKLLATSYQSQDTPPTWIAGDQDLDFDRHWKYISTTVQTSGSYARPTSSSGSSGGGGFSGGSSGGGFSGGGGGGGFSGGR